MTLWFEWWVRWWAAVYAPWLEPAQSEALRPQRTDNRAPAVDSARLSAEIIQLPRR